MVVADEPAEWESTGVKSGKARPGRRKQHHRLDRFGNGQRQPLVSARCHDLLCRMSQQASGRETGRFGLVLET